MHSGVSVLTVTSIDAATLAVVATTASTSGSRAYARAGDITTVAVTISEDPAATPGPASTAHAVDRHQGDKRLAVADRLIQHGPGVVNRLLNKGGHLAGWS